MAGNVLSQDGAHFFKYTTVTGNLPITVGSLQLIGNTPMVALEGSTVASETITMQVGGAVLLPKRAAGAATGGALTAGGRVYLFTATGEPNVVTGLAAAEQLIGYALEAATTGATTARVRLIDGPIEKETQT